MSADPSIWRRYQCPRVSASSISSTSKVSTPSGKCPHMITEWLHPLRTRLATRLAVKVERADRVGADATGCST